MTTKNQQVSSKYLTFWCISRYLSNDEIKILKDEIGKLKTNRKFISTLLRCFDIERLKTHPMHPLDILIYNHILYEKGGRSKLISRYNKEVYSKEIVEKA